MLKRQIKFLPPAGDRNSPSDYIQALTDDEAANIEEKLKLIADLEPYQWPGAWVKLVQGLYQFTYGNHRLYFLLDGQTLLIVYYACRKKSQKAKQEDISKAKANRDLYCRQYQQEGKKK